MPQCKAVRAGQLLYASCPNANKIVARGTLMSGTLHLSDHHLLADLRWVLWLNQSNLDT